MKDDEASQVQRWLGATGFSEELTVDGGHLLAQGSGEQFDPAEVAVPGAYRCDRGADTDHQGTVFAIASSGGQPIGTLLVEDGAPVTPELQSVVDELQARAETPAVACEKYEHEHVVAVFPDRDQAAAAVAELQDLGLGSDHLGVAVDGTDQVVFERDEEAVLGKRLAKGASLGALAGLALTALVIPGLAPLGIGGMFAVAPATGVGGAMLGGFLGIASVDDAFTAHGDIRETPLAPGEVLVAVLAHGERESVEAVAKHHNGTLLTLKPVLP